MISNAGFEVSLQILKTQLKGPKINIGSNRENLFSFIKNYGLQRVVVRSNVILSLPG